MQCIALENVKMKEVCVMNGTEYGRKWEYEAKKDRQRFNMGMKGSRLNYSGKTATWENFPRSSNS